MVHLCVYLFCTRNIELHTLIVECTAAQHTLQEINLDQQTERSCIAGGSTFNKHLMLQIRLCAIHLKSTFASLEMLQVCKPCICLQTVLRNRCFALPCHCDIAKLEELQHYNKSKKAWEMLPVCADLTHALFTKGVTTSNVTALRVLLKVDVVVAMLRRGELTDKGVVFDINLAQCVMPQKRELYWMKGGKYHPKEFADITNKDTFGIF